MPRPPKYTDNTERPVGVSLRIPKDLYDEVQRFARMRRSTLTELVLEGLRLRLETPVDPRDIVASHDNTAMQELQNLIDERIAMALAKQVSAYLATATQSTLPLSHDGKITVIQEPQAPVKPVPSLPHDGNITVTQEPQSQAKPVSALPHDDNITVMQDRASILARIRAWRQDERSFGWIAKQLNREGIPTFSGKGQWHPGTLKKWLDQA